MKRYWETTHRRGVFTLPVWAMKATFELRNLTLAQHRTNVESLPTLDEIRTGKELDLTHAMAARATCFTALRDLNVRVPGLIHGALEDDDKLHEDLDKIFAITPELSQDSDLRRARLVGKVWLAYNAQLAALTPPKPALTVRQGAADVTATQFVQMGADALVAQDAEGQAVKDLSEARSGLRTRDRKVDRDNKRWFESWTKAFPAGTPEGDVARSTVPTEAGQPAPTPLPIFSATPQAGRVVGVIYANEGGAHASTRELLYQLPGEPDFGHSTPVIMDGQLVGPFPPNTLVGLRTRVSNNHSGYVLGDIVQVLIPA